MDSEKDIFSTSKGRWDFAIAVIVISLFACLIYYFALKPEEQTTEVVLENEVMQSDAAETKKSLDTTPEIYQPVEIKIEDSFEETTGKAIVLADFKTKKSDGNEVISEQPMIKKSATPAPEEQIIKITDSTSKTELITTREHRSEAITEVEKEENVVVPKEGKNELTKVEETEKQLPATTSVSEVLDCVVVVGVFKNPENMAGVIEKLEVLGYKQSRGTLHEGLTYIGVPVACDQHKKKQIILEELNAIFKIDSWVKKK